MSNNSLSTIQPDFEGILEQLQANLANKKSWISLGKSSTAEILLEGIAMVGEYDQYSIGAAVNETTFDYAHLPESIYTNSRFLGIRISRRKPAHCTVILQNNDLNNSFIEIPTFTQFIINNVKYFNREPIVFNRSTNQQKVELYQGEIKTSIFYSSGSVYQTYELEERDPWSISDEDIICDIDNVRYVRSEDPVFQFAMGDRKFFENSLPNGNVECKFGNGVYGSVPQANAEIIFKYAVTLGSNGNNTLSELAVKCPTYDSVIGETTTNAIEGSDEEDLLFYKELGPESGASNGRGIIRDDFKPLVIKYPGVIDCNVYGQAEIAPNDKKWMNVIGLMLLTENDFNDISFKNLVKYLKSKSVYGFQFKWYKPERVDVELDIKLYLKPNANLEVCRDLVITALQKLTKLRIGSLGRSLYGSDIENAVLSAIPNDIDYLDKTVPLINFVINKNQYINVTNINIEANYSERDTQDWVNKIDPYGYQENQ